MTASSMLTIRPLAAHDSIDELTALLHRAYARLGAMGLNYTAVDQSSAVTTERLAGGACFIAEWSGMLAGTVVVKPTYGECECAYFTKEGVAAAHQFGVDPALQGRGIGRRLLEHCETWARMHGFRELALDTAESADHLVRLYTRLGYVHVGHIQWSGKVYRSIVLSKRLS